MALTKIRCSGPVWSWLAAAWACGCGCAGVLAGGRAGALACGRVGGRFCLFVRSFVRLFVCLLLCLCDEVNAVYYLWLMFFVLLYREAFLDVAGT